MNGRIGQHDFKYNEKTGEWTATHRKTGDVVSGTASSRSGASFAALNEIAKLAYQEAK